jgi:hypothetical protein
MRTTAARRAMPADLGAGPDWCGCKLKDNGLLVPTGLPREAWLTVGRTLSRLESSAQWAIGDWWAFGAATFGERSALIEPEAWQGPAFQTCMNYGSVARAFKTSRRREVLSFSHHAEVAGRLLSEGEVDALLDWAEEAIAESGRPRSVRALREERQRREREKSAGQATTRTLLLEVARDTLSPREITVDVHPWPSPCAQRTQPAATESACPPARAAAVECPDATKVARSPVHPGLVVRPSAAEPTAKEGSQDADAEAIRMVAADVQRALASVRRALAALPISPNMRERLVGLAAALEAPGLSVH